MYVYAGELDRGEFVRGSSKESATAGRLILHHTECWDRFR